MTHIAPIQEMHEAGVRLIFARAAGLSETDSQMGYRAYLTPPVIGYYSGGGLLFEITLGEGTEPGSTLLRLRALRRDAVDSWSLDSRISTGFYCSTAEGGLNTALGYLQDAIFG